LFCFLILGAVVPPDAWAAGNPSGPVSALGLGSNLPSTALRKLHVFHYGTLKSPLDKLGLRPRGGSMDWSAEFTLTPQQPAVITANQNTWPPGSLSAFGASQWYGQGYPGWWTGQISLSDPTANVFLLLLAKGGKTYLIDETVAADSPGQFTITGPDGTTSGFPATAISETGCITTQHIQVLYEPEQDGAVNFELQYAPTGAPSTGAFCSVTVSVLQ
jgi:hypothetical protein